MSLNTTQIIHIVADVAILMSITVYFMNENKKLVSQIDTLSKKVESQEDRITKQDGVMEDEDLHQSDQRRNVF